MGDYAEYEGTLDARGLRIAVIAGRFNTQITKPLLEGALSTLADLGAGDVDVHWVPGAFEIPLVAKRLASSGSFDAVICLGAVIRGDTAHFEYVAGPCADGIARAAYDTGVPITFGVLTTENERQALDRAGGHGGNKGSEAAQTAVEMALLLRTLPGGTTC